MWWSGLAMVRCSRRPLRLIVPFPRGGRTAIYARVIVPRSSISPLFPENFETFTSNISEACKELRTKGPEATDLKPISSSIFLYSSKAGSLSL